MNGSSGQNRTKGGHLGTANSSGISYKRSCEKDDQCGLWADCVALNHNEPKRCWCVNDMRSPDPDTGGCRSTSSGLPHDRSRNGVLFQHHLRDIFLSAEGNVTAGGMANESSALLLIPAAEPSMLLPWEQIILPALGSFVFVSIIVVLAVIYRRRFTIKEYYANRQPGIYTRHNDGVILLDRMNYVKNNPTYFCQNSLLTRRHNVPEVSCEHLKLEEVVGEGAFGQVFRVVCKSPWGMGVNSCVV